MNEKEIIKLHKEKNTVAEIAEKFGTYPNKIKRILIKNCVELMGRSESAKLSFQKGRRKSPTKGKPLPPETKTKISEKVSKAWENKDYRDTKEAQSKDFWDNMTDKERAEFSQKGQAKIREAAKSGSKLEKYLYSELIKLGFNVQFHREHLLSNHKLHIDLFVPERQTAIEVDGVAHTSDIWGSRKLNQTQTSDIVKNGLLLGAGLNVFRLRVSAGTLSQKVKRDALSCVVDVLNNLQGQTKQLVIKEI